MTRRLGRITPVAIAFLLLIGGILWPPAGLPAFAQETGRKPPVSGEPPQFSGPRMEPSPAPTPPPKTTPGGDGGLRRGRGHGHRGHHHGHHRFHHRFHHRQLFHYGHPFFYGLGFAYYPFSLGTVVYPNPRYGGLGALDVNVRPKRAQIYLDGQYIGEARQFDGWPSYLWLEEGTYDLVFYLPGYRTLARQYSIYPGLIIRVNDRLEPGESVHPNDLPAKTHERRDYRLRREQERREKAEREGAYGREEDATRRETPPSAYPERGGVPEGGVVDARPEPGQLRLTVRPEDASVYLDGRFLGTGLELARLRAGLIVAPGSHLLEVVRPGYRIEELTFEVEPGEEVEFTVELSPD